MNESLRAFNRPIKVSISSFCSQMEMAKIRHFLKI